MFTTVVHSYGIDFRVFLKTYHRETLTSTKAVLLIAYYKKSRETLGDVKSVSIPVYKSLAYFVLS